MVATSAVLLFAGAAVADQLLPTDLTYLGAFRVPSTDPYAGMGAIAAASSMTYRPDGDPSGGGDGYPGSLIFSNRGWVAEITIPAPVKTTNAGALPVANEIRSVNGITGSVNQGSNDSFGAVAYLPAGGAHTTAQIYWTTYIYYNVAGVDYPSIGRSNVDLSAASAVGLWHVGPAASTFDSAYHGQKYGDYIIPIDQAWADQYTGGRSLLVGRYREAGAAGGSMGPVLTAIGPWLDSSLAAGANLSAVPLMYFNSITLHTSDTTWMQFRLNGDPNYTYYSAGDRWHGGAWVARGTKKALILVGRHGTFDDSNPCPPTASGDGCHGAVGTSTPPYCYGTGYVDCPAPIAVTNNKGYHNGPYRPRLLFIDPDDLAKVAQGTKAANTVGPYTVFDPSGDWPWTDSDNFNDIVGAAYDSANGILYVAEGNAYRPGGGSSTPWPIVHVYSVSGTATPVPSPPLQLTVH
jgi:hypothetical protein